MFKRVAVIMGGVSSEREISLASGRAVAAALDAAGLEVIEVDLRQEALDGMPAGGEAAFIALHGGYGENGGVQADLDALGLPYTGPGAAASRLAIDKVATKLALEPLGVPVPPYEVLGPGDELCALELPLVVKPPRDGSSVGLARVERAEELAAALAGARRCDPAGEVLVERYIAGRELTVGVLAGEALPVVEIRAPGGWYDYSAKYGAGQSEYLFPSEELEGEMLARARVLALVAFEALGCRGVGRVDFRLAPDGALYLLEINTVPGFTATSLLPKAAARAGLGFTELCLRVLAAARTGA